MGPVAEMPLLMLVTTTVPVRLLQERSTGAPVRTTISVPDTDSTWAATPAMVTATGATNPCPKMVTCWPPRSGPEDGAMAEMNIASP